MKRRNSTSSHSSSSSDSSRKSADSNDSNDSNESTDVVNVDFDFFSPQEIDFLGLKTLFSQLLPHSELPNLSLSNLADFVIRQPKVGTTVKVVDETDPYAILTCIDLNSDSEEVKTLKEYILAKGGDDVQKLLKGKVALVINERLINMPPQIAPPMFTFLLDEVKPLKYTHFVYISKTYTEVSTEKHKKVKHDAAHFQAEDEVLAKRAVLKKAFKLSQDKSKKNSFDEFGIESSRMILVLDQAGFKAAVKAMESFIGSPGV